MPAPTSTSFLCREQRDMHATGVRFQRWCLPVLGILPKRCSVSLQPTSEKNKLDGDGWSPTLAGMSLSKTGRCGPYRGSTSCCEVWAVLLLTASHSFLKAST